VSIFKKIIFLGIGIFVPLVIVLIGLELIFGAWFFKDKWRQTREINIVRNIVIDYDVDNIYGKKMPTVKYTRDINGLRGTCNKPNNIDVLTVGGSTTDQRFVGDGETYQDELQRLLSDQAKKNICVSNAGVDGHSTYGHLASFKHWFPLIEGLKPRYFLLYVGVNDAGFRHAPNAGADIAKGNTLFRIFRQNSALYDLLRSLRSLLNTFISQRAYAGHRIFLPSEKDYVAVRLTNSVEKEIVQNTHNFKKRFTAILDQVHLWGGVPVCVSQPHLYTKDINGSKRGVENIFEYQGVAYNGLDYDASIYSINQEMKELCTSNNGYFIDIYSKKFDKGDFYDGVHMTPIGAKRLGRYIFTDFVSQKIPI
jgi:hypothetical protein